MKDYSDFLGVRFFKKDDKGDLIVLKVTSFASAEKARVININTKDSFKIPYEELETEYNKLEPDGHIIFNIVELNDGIEDVIVSVFRQEDIDNHAIMPYCVARQNIVNIYNEFIKKYDTCTSVGMCMTINTIPENIDYRIMLACNGVKFQTMVAYYIDDTLDDILGCIRKIKVYDATLNILFENNIKILNKKNPDIIEYDKPEKLDSYGGYNRTLRSFLDMVDFMIDLRKGHNIHTINFSIGDIGTENACTIMGQTLINLELALGQDLKNAVITKYDKYIDLEKIPREYILFCDDSDSLYIIIYDK